MCERGKRQCDPGVSHWGLYYLGQSLVPRVICHLCLYLLCLPEQEFSQRAHYCCHSYNFNLGDWVTGSKSSGNNSFVGMDILHLCNDTG